MIVVSYIVPRLPVYYVDVVDLWVFIYEVFFSVLFGKCTLNDEARFSTNPSQLYEVILVLFGMLAN